MTNRQVKIPLVSYRDREGRVRHALQYENIDVGAEWLEDFDRLNLGDDYTPRKPKGPAVTKPTPTSRRSKAKAAAKAAGRAPTPKRRA